LEYLEDCGDVCPEGWNCMKISDVSTEDRASHNELIMADFLSKTEVVERISRGYQRVP
jgi:hypothetical protein